MHELDEPATGETAAPSDTDTTTAPPRTSEAIMAEARALGERIRDPNTPDAERKALRLYILRELMPEMGRNWTPEDDAKSLEVARGIDSHRPPGHKLFEHVLGKEGS